MENELVVKKPEAQTDTWAEPTERVVEHVAKPERDGVVVTSKAGTGFDAPWIVLHAVDIQDAINQFNSDEYTELMDLAARKSKEFAKAFGGSAGTSKPAASSGGWGAKKLAAKQSVSEPDEEGPECDHGVRNWVTGRSAKGPWQAWMCPAEKNDRSKCDPIWANKDGSPQDR